jgi:hypothetical protein
MGYKIVVNKCFGGFGVSEKGVEWLLAHGADPKDVRMQDSGLAARFVYSVCTMSRHHPLLVEMVETLGEEANGPSASLMIVEIDQPMYRIDEYDGSENIEEPDHVHWDNAQVWEA